MINVPSIYFTLRSDQRGILYCEPNYFNYQSHELSKSFLLFANPGVIDNSNVECIRYLKPYGANCYGGTVSKKIS